MNAKLLLLFMCCLVVACSSAKRTSISLADYQSACSVAADCVAVSVGKYCPCTPCANAAINRSSLSQYKSDVSDVDCGNTSDIFCAACPSLPTVDCVQGKCALAP